jgi:hypothetical protein
MHRVICQKTLVNAEAGVYKMAMMRRVRWILLALLVWSPGLLAAQCQGQTTQLVFLSDEFLPVGETATGLTPARYQTGGFTAQLAVIQVQQAPVVHRLVTNPTATVGGPVGAGTSFPICGFDNIKAFRAIRQTPTDSVLYVNYYRIK